MDQVLIRLTDRLNEAKNNLSGAQARWDKCKASVIDSHGNVRPGFAQESAARQVAVDALKEHVIKLQKNLKSAQDDLPRRTECRKKAEEFEAKALILDGKASKLYEELAKVEAEANNLRSQKEEHLSLASKPLEVLQAIEEEQLETKKKIHDEKLQQLENETRSAKIDLKDYQAHGHIDEAQLQKRIKRVELCEKAIQDFSEKGEVVHV